jgi:EAL domain-containing protein (putative c-di-GMP-specific phosphodiesterase class I)
MARELLSTIERGEIRTYYQPRLRVEDGRCAGMEALARWHSDRLGSVSPTEFIRVAEEVDLIGAIGRQMLENACRDTVAWARTASPPLRVSVNVSALELLSPDYARQVGEILIASGLPPDNLELEITERLAVVGLGGAEETIHQLRSMGVRFALDDFGSGFSALSCLVHLPLDILKLDRTLIRHIESNPDVGRLVRGTCALAHELGLEVVAEGVDALEQVDLLREAGCDEIQGFALAEPMPDYVFTSYLSAQDEKPDNV